MMKKSFKISDSLAQMIVDAAKEVIGKDINLIQLDGIIIASTNPNRIGSIHYGALQVIRNGGPIIVSEDHEIIGTKKGINYPIVIDQQILGIIGISGDPEECQTLGFLLTKITEVLIKEQMILSRVYTLDELRSSIVRILIFENESNKDTVNELIRQFRLELEEYVFVGIIQFHGMNDPSFLPFNMQNVLLNHGIKLFTYLFPNQYVFILNQSQYNTFIQSLTINLQSIKIKFSVGVGGVYTLDEITTSYKNAKLALKHALLKQISICEYSKLDLEMLMENLDSSIRKDYAMKLIGKLTEEDIALLQVYYKNNLSLKMTAKELFIHKNTLQYRLNKITEIINLDPRDFHDSVKIYVALLLQTL